MRLNLGRTECAPRTQCPRKARMPDMKNGTTRITPPLISFGYGLRLIAVAPRDKQYLPILTHPMESSPRYSRWPYRVNSEWAVGSGILPTAHYSFITAHCSVPSLE